PLPGPLAPRLPPHEPPHDPRPGSTWSPAPGRGEVSPRTGATRTGRWATGATTAAVIAVLLVLGAAGLFAYAGATGGRGQSNAVSSVSGGIVPSAARRAALPSLARPNAVPSTSVPSTTAPPSSTVPPSSVPPSTPPQTAPAAPAASALSGLGPLTGDWSGHGGGVHIGADGQGQATFRAYRLRTPPRLAPPPDGRLTPTRAVGRSRWARSAPCWWPARWRSRRGEPWCCRTRPGFSVGRSPRPVPALSADHGR